MRCWDGTRMLVSWSPCRCVSCAQRSTLYDRHSRVIEGRTNIQDVDAQCDTGQDITCKKHIDLHQVI